jgi:hypothetical protein
LRMGNSLGFDRTFGCDGWATERYW